MGADEAGVPRYLQKPNPVPDREGEEKGSLQPTPPATSEHQENTKSLLQEFL
jgi:hypothetical protein